MGLSWRFTNYLPGLSLPSESCHPLLFPPSIISMFQGCEWKQYPPSKLCPSREMLPTDCGALSQGKGLSRNSQWGNYTEVELVPVQEELHCCNSAQGTGRSIKGKSRGRTCRGNENLLLPSIFPERQATAAKLGWVSGL